MKERPIMFRAPMVRAILAGEKTQTRRFVRRRRDHYIGCELAPNELAGEINGGDYTNSPYEPGMRLWVRETWARDDEDGALFYRADVGTGNGADDWERNRLDGVTRYHWRPSIHMPRWASRITLEVTGVRVERLKNISEADAAAEGTPGGHGAIPGYAYNATAVEHYRSLWEQINGPGSWYANPWVWVIEFRGLP